MMKRPNITIEVYELKIIKRRGLKLGGFLRHKERFLYLTNTTGNMKSTNSKFQSSVSMNTASD